MTNIFQQILDCRSLTNLDYLCEEALAAPGLAQPDRDALQRILGTNSLDERYALAHEHLGNREKAATLRQWMAGAAQRRQQNQQQSLLLFDELR